MNPVTHEYSPEAGWQVFCPRCNCEIKTLKSAPHSESECISTLQAKLSDAQESINFWMAAKDHSEQAITADATRFRWLMADADRCAGVVADAYKDWDTDMSWEMTLKTEIDHRYFSLNQGVNDAG